MSNPQCPDCGATTEQDDDSETLYTCDRCDTTVMDNDRFNERFSL